MTVLRKHIIGVAALIGAAIAMPAHAAPSSLNTVLSASPLLSVENSASYVKYAQNLISPSKAKAIAAQRVRGAKFVDISRSGRKYRVRMLRKDGRVVDVFIDATTGRVLN